MPNQDRTAWFTVCRIVLWYAVFYIESNRVQQDFRKYLLHSFAPQPSEVSKLFRSPRISICSASSPDFPITLPNVIQQKTELFTRTSPFFPSLVQQAFLCFSVFYFCCMRHCQPERSRRACPERSRRGPPVLRGYLSVIFRSPLVVFTFTMEAPSPMTCCAFFFASFPFRLPLFVLKFTVAPEP